MAASPESLDATLSRMDYGRALKAELLMTEKPEAFVPYAQPLLDAVSLFDELSVGYAVIGGVAAMYYGRARFTEDVDFVAISGHMEILEKHPAEMEKFHFDPVCTSKLYHKSGVKVDIRKDDHADAIIERALTVQLVGRAVKIIEPHDLIAMKLRAHRLKDDYDISQILAFTRIDESRLEQMITPEQRLHLLEIKRRS